MSIYEFITSKNMRLRSRRVAKQICALGLVVALPLSAAEPMTLSPSINLPVVSVSIDEQTRALLNDKKTFVLGVSGDNFEPYEILQGRNLKGIVADYVHLVSQSLGIGANVVLYPDRPSAIQALKRGQIDVLASGSISAKNLEFLYSIPYTLNFPAIVGRGKNLGTPQGKIQGNMAYSSEFVELQQLRESFESISPTAYSSALEALHAVEYQKQQWYIGDPIVIGYYKAQGELQYIHTYPERRLRENGYSFMFTQHNDFLRAAFDTVLTNNPKLQKQKIINYWADRVEIEKADGISLTEEEKQWLSSHPDVLVAVNSALPPYSFYDENGEMTGVVIDLLEAISREVGVNFKVVENSSANAIEQTIRTKRADMTLTLLPNEERSTYLRFTEPYLFNSFALVTKKGSVISAVSDLGRKSVAVQRSNLVAAKIKQSVPTVKLIGKMSQLDSLVAVANGEADAAVVLLPTATYLIRQFFSDDLKVSTSLPDIPANLPISVRADQAPLFSIMSKAIQHLGPHYINGLMSNWKAVPPAHANLWQDYISSVRLLSSFAAFSFMLLLGCTIFFYLRRRQTKLEVERFEFRSTLLDSIPMAISVRDQEGKFVFCNQVFYSMVRAQPTDVIGKNTFEFIELNKELIEEHQRIYFQTLKNGLPDQRQFDATVNGNQLTLRQWDRPYTDKNGTIAGLISGYADMTSNVLLLQQLRDSHDRAVEANEAKSRFLAVMSHEIRTPLNAIIGLLELTIQRIERGESWERTDLEVAFGSSKSLIALIDDILDLAKIESGNLTLAAQRTSLPETIRSVTRIFSGVARQKGLYLHLEEDLQSKRDVSLDSGRLKQVLSNLLSNAIKFTDRGGVKIKVTSRRAVEGAAIEIFISDTGIGISPSDQQKLFKPFTQAATISHSRGGTGLGLAICRQLVQMMGGTLVLDSTFGQGTRVIMRLTAPELDAKERTSEMPIIRQPLRKKLHVLLVDDHPANRLLLGQQLQFLGHTIEEAQDGSEALALLYKNPFDMVITDCNMPVMDGYELTRIWRTHESNNRLEPCWIMGFTANAQPQERIRCLEAGMDGCLFKPVSLAELSACLESLYPRTATTETTAVNDSLEPSALIDRSSVAAITNGNDKLAAMLLNQLHTSNGLDLQQLNEKIQDCQWKEIALLAHRLKGVARLINSKALIEATHTYETELTNGVTDDQKRELALNMRQSLERLQAAISNELKQTLNTLTD